MFWTPNAMMEEKKINVNLKMSRSKRRQSTVCTCTVGIKVLSQLRIWHQPLDENVNFIFTF